MGLLNKGSSFYKADRNMTRNNTSVKDVTDSYYVKFIKCLRMGIDVNYGNYEKVLDYAKARVPELLNALEYYKLLELLISTSKVETPMDSRVALFTVQSIVRYITNILELRHAKRVKERLFD